MKFERIGNIAKFINGAAFRPGDWGNEGKKIIRIQNLTDPNKPYNYTRREVDEKYIVKKGDVLVSWSATIDVFIWDDEDALLNQHIFKVVFDYSKVEKNYFILALKSTIAELSKFAHGSTMKHVVKGDFENHTIPLPALPIQIYITNVLNQVEKLIFQRKQSIALLDEFIRSTFLEMFGDPVRNEKEWQQVPLSKLGSLDRGVSKNRPRNLPELLGGIYPLIQTGEVSNSGLYITSYTQTYSELGLKQSKIWKKGTMLITIAANIARTSILTFDACFPDSICGFIADNAEANTIYVHSLFSFFQAFLEKNAPQAAQKNINLAVLRNLLVPKPPLSLQNNFAEIVSKTETLKQQYRQSLLELENLFGSLSQQAFKGELDFEKLVRITENRFSTIDINTENSVVTPNTGDRTNFIELENENTIIVESNIENRQKDGEVEEEIVNAIQPENIKDENSANKDFTKMSLDEYYGVPEEIQAEYGSIETKIIDWEFFLKKHFANTVIITEDVEELFNRIYYEESDKWFKYKKFKKFIFEELKKENSFLQQEFNILTKQMELTVKNETTKA